MKGIVIVFNLLLLTTIIQAKIILPSVITDNMVLQQNQLVSIWGWTTEVGEQIKVCGSWNRDTVSVKARMGVFEVKLQTPSYGGPYVVDIVGHEKHMIKNVMIGEVWVASGQSNMFMPVDSVLKRFQGVVNYKEEIKAADYPQIRMFTVSRIYSEHPQDNALGDWKVCSPENVKNFSATAYFFAKSLHQNLDIPIGIISSSWGGSNAKWWLSEEALAKNERLKEYYMPTAKQENKWQIKTGGLFNAMIHPFVKYAIKGVIWYQGESNRNDAVVYKDLMTSLIEDWRALWGYDFPFYFTQIAPYNYTKGVSGAYIREAQMQTLSVFNTGMAVTNDVGDLNNIHPLQKQQVGERLALWALAKDYHKDVVFSGPLYRSMSVQKNEIVIEFDYTEGGLVLKGELLTNFEIAGEDQVFLSAQAKIKGDKVIVFNSKIKNPVAVRFAFSDTAQANLYNQSGLPASSFRTDDWGLK